MDGGRRLRTIRQQRSMVVALPRSREMAQERAGKARFKRRFHGGQTPIFMIFIYNIDKRPPSCYTIQR